MKKLLKFLDEDSWKIKLARIVPEDEDQICSGLADPQTKEIFIDVRAELIPTLIHESVHALTVDDPMSARQDEQTAQEIEIFIRDRLTEEHMVRLVNFLIHPDRLLAKSFPIVYEAPPEKYRQFTLIKLLKP